MAKVKSTAQKVTQRIATIDQVGFYVNKYDFDNKYPQRVIDISNDSGTAQACLELKRKFVFGGGLKNLDFYKSKVNPTTTADKFLRNLIDDYSKLGGCAIHFNYNMVGQKTTITFVPFEYCRTVPTGHKEEGKIAMYSDWGHSKRLKFSPSDVTYINSYNPKSAVQEMEAVGIENYKGQIYYWTPNGAIYPLSPFDSVLEDMLTEAQTKKFKHSTSANNFLASHLLITGKSESDEEAEQFDENLRQFQGGEGSGTIMVIERESEGETIELKKIEIQDYDGLYSFTEDSSVSSIIRRFLIPPVLLLRVAGSLGTSKEISDAYDYYNVITSDDRLLMEELLTEMFTDFAHLVNSEMDFSILPLKYSKAISAEYLSYYTKNEIRVANGDEELKDVKADSTLLAVTLGVGGTQALTSILADTVLTVEQKKGTLMVLFGLNETQTNQMLGL